MSTDLLLISSLLVYFPCPILPSPSTVTRSRCSALNDALLDCRIFKAVRPAVHTLARICRLDKFEMIFLCQKKSLLFVQSTEYINKLLTITIYCDMIYLRKVKERADSVCCFSWLRHSDARTASLCLFLLFADKHVPVRKTWGRAFCIFLQGGIV